MPVETTAYAVPSAGAPFERTTIQRREVGEHDVLVDVAYSGICHSDIHNVRGEWGEKPWPLVPGHEITGTVREVGPGVTRHAVGDQVGIGVYIDSCRTCAACTAGQQQHCYEGMTETYGSPSRLDGKTTQGGYSGALVVDEAYVMKIPQGLPLDGAAPLLCAGITVWAPLKRHGAGPGKQVAVVGLGGLGHMAVKLAHALGAEVTVLSQSLSKQEDGKRLGADHYHATSDPATFEQLANRFDIIVNTVSATLDMDAYMRLLAVDGTLSEVGLPEQPITISGFSLVDNGRSITGSKVGGLAEIQEMLDFCGEHGISADVEVVRADQIDEAHDRVVASDVRYRFVIDGATIGA